MNESFSEALKHVYERIAAILPNAAVAVAIVLVGIVASTACYFVVIRVFEFFAVDKLADKTPLRRMLKGIGISKKISEIFGLLVFWLGIFITLDITSERLQIAELSAVLDRITNYIPQVIAAFLIIVVGMLLAKFLQTIVKRAFERAQLSYGDTAGRAVYIIILIYVFLLAFEQLNPDFSLITIQVTMIGYGLLFLFAFAAVFASRTTLENALACFQLRRILTEGTEVEINDIHGTVKQLTATSVILSAHGKDIVLPALDFFTTTYSLKQKHEH